MQCTAGIVNNEKKKVKVLVSHSVTLWTVACQASLSMEFSRQGYWSGQPFLLQYWIKFWKEQLHPWKDWCKLTIRTYYLLIAKHIIWPTQVRSLGSGRSSGGKNGNSLHYSGLGNLMDGGTGWAAASGVAKSQTCLSDWIKSSFEHTLSDG